MNNPFDYTPDPACDEAFRQLEERLATLKASAEASDVAFMRDLEGGKMLGVLIASDSEGIRHTLYAFSGQSGCGGFHHPWFVGPVFDYLQPDGHFKIGEAEISRMNGEIAQFEETQLNPLRERYEQAAQRAAAETDHFKQQCRQAKQERQAARQRGGLSDAELAAMIRRSQFEKAELHRLKKKMESMLIPLREELTEAQKRLDTLKERRRRASEALQQWLFDHFMLSDATGRMKSLSEIFADTPLRIPPSGAGECCAPKLLHAARQRGLSPIAIAEYWYGAPKGGEIRMHGRHYPACRGKCGPVLGWMLHGMEIVPPLDTCAKDRAETQPEILYENSHFCVISKPAGMLSVPGKGVSLSLQEWLTDRYGAERDVRMAHRLDRDTSGLMIATFGLRSYRLMQSLFATRKVRKTYVALLEGDYRVLDIPASGRIDLPLSPDWLDRPRQRVDAEGGKPAVTDYEFTGIAGGRSRVMFHPLTGRTHQLRVHAASVMGLGMPIAGDPLYGTRQTAGQERLCLHAFRLEFTFPDDGREYRFELPVPF